MTAPEQPRVTFSETSSVSSGGDTGPRLLLYVPEVPKGWEITGLEVTERGNVQVRIERRPL